MPSIQLKRGNKSNLPNSALPGEPLITMDTYEIFFGTLSNSVVPLQLFSSNIIDKNTPNGVAILNENGNIENSIENNNMLFSGISSTIINNNENKILLSFPKNLYKLIKCIIYIYDNTDGNIYSSEFLSTHNDLEAMYSEYGSMGQSFVDIYTEINGANFLLRAISHKDNQSIKAIISAIKL